MSSVTGCLSSTAYKKLPFADNGFVSSDEETGDVTISFGDEKCCSHCTIAFFGSQGVGFAACGIHLAMNENDYEGALKVLITSWCAIYMIWFIGERVYSQRRYESLLIERCIALKSPHVSVVSKVVNNWKLLNKFLSTLDKQKKRLKVDTESSSLLENGIRKTITKVELLNRRTESGCSFLALAKDERCRLLLLEHGADYFVRPPNNPLDKDNRDSLDVPYGELSDFEQAVRDRNSLFVGELITTYLKDQEIPEKMQLKCLLLASTYTVFRELQTKYNFNLDVKDEQGRGYLDFIAERKTLPPSYGFEILPFIKDDMGKDEHAKISRIISKFDVTNNNYDEHLKLGALLWKKGYKNLLLKCKAFIQNEPVVEGEKRDSIIVNSYIRALVKEYSCYVDPDTILKYVSENTQYNYDTEVIQQNKLKKILDRAQEKGKVIWIKESTKDTLKRN